MVSVYTCGSISCRAVCDTACRRFETGGVNLYGKATIVFLALASLSYITSEHRLNWDIGYQFGFLSYLLMGYKLRQWGKNRKNNRVALLFILAGFAVNGILGYINYQRGLSGLPVGAVIQYYKNPFSHTPLAPIEVIASCLIFAGFSMLDIKNDFSKLARYTFLIYLFHAGIWDIISTLIGDRLIGNQWIEAVAVIMLSIVVFIISLLAAIIYKSISNALKSKIKPKI